MELVVARARDPDAMASSNIFVQAMSYVPGWDEKNFQVGASVRETRSDDMTRQSSHLFCIMVPGPGPHYYACQARFHAPGLPEACYGAIPAALQVMAKQFEVLRIVSEAPTFSKREAFVCLGGLIDKVREVAVRPLQCSAVHAAFCVAPTCLGLSLHRASLPYMQA